MRIGLFSIIIALAEAQAGVINCIWQTQPVLYGRQNLITFDYPKCYALDIELPSRQPQYIQLAPQPCPGNFSNVTAINLFLAPGWPGELVNVTAHCPSVGQVCYQYFLEDGRLPGVHGNTSAAIACGGYNFTGSSAATGPSVASTLGPQSVLSSSGAEPTAGAAGDSIRVSVEVDLPG
jgi:hypothetical protein